MTTPNVRQRNKSDHLCLVILSGKTAGGYETGYAVKRGEVALDDVRGGGGAGFASWARCFVVLLVLALIAGVVLVLIFVVFKDKEGARSNP